MATYRSESNFDYVASACVWSGDSYGANKSASQTSGVVYISGVRLPVSAVVSRTFTASKDTYVDINGSGVQVYTEVTNNAASPALSAGSLRLGIIVTGASSIAAAGSVNQGQESIILPIASSIAYSVQDSLGNLICPRDINRKLLGYRQILSNFAPGTNAETLVTGLNCPVITPTNRKVKISIYSLTYTAATTTPVARIYNGVFGSGGTQIQQNNGTGVGGPLYEEVIQTSASTTYTFSIAAVTGNDTLSASSTAPAFAKVELE